MITSTNLNSKLQAKLLYGRVGVVAAGAGVNLLLARRPLRALHVRARPQLLRRQVQAPPHGAGVAEALARRALDEYLHLVALLVVGHERYVAVDVRQRRVRDRHQVVLKWLGCEFNLN